MIVQEIHQIGKIIKTSKFDINLLSKFQKNFKLLEHEHFIYHFEAGDLKIPNIIIYKELFKGLEV